MARRRKKLITTDEAKPAKKQHTRCCSDCPWSVEALPGWTGSLTPEEWLQVARTDQAVPCHVHPNRQCAGIAVYRRNVCKLVRGDALVLPADRERVFATPVAFLAHHADSNPPEEEDDDE